MGFPGFLVYFRATRGARFNARAAYPRYFT
jgi:hypothetical protein